MGEAILNRVILTGRVGSFKDYKAFESGACCATINLGVKRGEKYSNIFVKFFNNPKSQIADRVCEELKEGDYIQVTGKIVEQSFTPKGWEGQLDEKGRQRTVSKLEVYGFSYCPAYFDEEIEKWQTVE